MSELVLLLKWEVLLFLAALAGLVAIQLLTRQINTSGLLYGRVSSRKRGEDRYFSPERVQLLVFTLGTAFYYLSQVLMNSNPGTFPAVPDSWTAVVGGSNAIYLGGKAWARWLGQ
jgi:hypothetical protein